MQQVKIDPGKDGLSRLEDKSILIAYSDENRN